jgi:hypothetical protein
MRKVTRERKPQLRTLSDLAYLFRPWNGFLSTKYSRQRSSASHLNNHKESTQ